MAAQVSDWGGTLFPRCRGGRGKQLTMVMMFVGRIELGDKPNIVSALGPHVIWLEAFMEDKNEPCLIVSTTIN